MKEETRFMIPMVILGLCLLLANCHISSVHTDSYKQNRTHDQVLQHGNGGCTPNFATGGCL